MSCPPVALSIVTRAPPCCPVLAASFPPPCYPVAPRPVTLSTQLPWPPHSLPALPFPCPPTPPPTRQPDAGPGGTGQSRLAHKTGQMDSDRAPSAASRTRRAICCSPADPGRRALAPPRHEAALAASGPKTATAPAPKSSARPSTAAAALRRACSDGPPGRADKTRTWVGIPQDHEKIRTREPCRTWVGQGPDMGRHPAPRGSRAAKAFAHRRRANARETRKLAARSLPEPTGGQGPPPPPAWGAYHARAPAAAASPPRRPPRPTATRVKAEPPRPTAVAASFEPRHTRSGCV